MTILLYSTNYCLGIILCSSTSSSLLSETVIPLHSNHYSGNEDETGRDDRKKIETRQDEA
jgi:hypothetical protein